MAAPKVKAQKDPLARELAQIANVWAHPASSPTLDPTDAEMRLRRGWALRAPVFEGSFALASEPSRALFARAQAFVEAGLPRGRRDPDEQAAFFAVAASANAPDAPCWADFYRRWVEDGGLEHAIAVALRIPATREDVVRREAVLLPDVTDLYPSWLLAALGPKVDELDPRARAALVSQVAPLAHAADPAAAAALAILLDDQEIAEASIARADAAGSTFRAPWPVGLFSVLRAGEPFARLLARGAAAFQFFGSGYVLRARGRVPDAGLADALLHFFVAALHDPRRMQVAFVRKFAAVACTVADRRLAWFFDEHGGHPFLERHAALYPVRHPDVRKERPSDATLAARMAPEPEAPRPPGFSKEELDVLDEGTREDRLVAHLSKGHLATALVLRLLADHPSPRVAGAVAATLAHPDFATQMPKPGFHKELAEDLDALVARHPGLAEAVAASRKGRRRR